MRADGVGGVTQNNSSEQESAVIDKLEALLEKVLYPGNSVELESALDDLIDNLLHLDYGYRVNIFGRAYSFNGRRITLPQHIHQMVTLYERWKSLPAHDRTLESLILIGYEILGIGAKAYLLRNQVSLLLGRSERTKEIYQRFYQIFFNHLLLEFDFFSSRNCGSFLAWVPDFFCQNYELMSELIPQEPKALWLASPGFQAANRELVESALKENGFSLEFASHEVRADKELVTIALEWSIRALEFVADELLSDREFLKSTLWSFSSALELLSPEVQADRELVAIAAISSNCSCLRYPVALHYAAPGLRMDQDFIQRLVEKGCLRALCFAAPGLRADRKFVERLLKIKADVLEFASPELRVDQDFIQRLVEKGCVGVLRFAAPELRADRKFVEGLLKINADVLEFASPEFRADRTLVEAAVANDGMALEFAAHALKADRELVKMALSSYEKALRFSGAELPPYWSTLHFNSESETGIFLSDTSVDLSEYPGILLLAVAQFDSWKKISTWLGSNKDKSDLIKAHVTQVAGRWNTPYKNFLLFLYGVSSAYGKQHLKVSSAIRLMRRGKIDKYHRAGVLYLIAAFAGVRMESEFVEEEGQLALIKRRSDWSFVNAAANKLGWQSLLEQKAVAEPAQANEAAAEATDESTLSMAASWWFKG